MTTRCMVKTKTKTRKKVSCVSVEGGCEGRVEAGTADGVDYRGKERIRFMDSAKSSQC